ncbi:zona pellucida sperm-binding protein 2-like [Pantherophis guttatus]|uniref:Zona pellucida sperm-binding protein 2-like n=1 Tax=Pantherophis guttatus TaxID=94885 RepID=A0A6P9D2Q6_PANGU|nr:zona pellucida sperm-binding protein 2-like [Pantherophis guttatus]
MVSYLAIRLFLLVVLVPSTWLQFVSLTDQVEVECLGSLAKLKLNPSYFQNKYVGFAALDRFGRAWSIDEVQAMKCGYTIFQDAWGNIEFRASLIGCYTQIVDDQQFTLTIQIQAATNPEMHTATLLNVPVSCSYGPWQPREIVCETNYMEVSVRRNVPSISDGFLQDQPEDWASAFSEVKTGTPSIWQIVFHMGSEKSSMMVEEAQAAGYGIKMTETRIVLRAPYNASQAQKVEISGIPFSSVRSSTYYKERFLLFMVDAAMACPIDGITYTEETITWTIPKHVSLLIGTATIKELHVEMGVDLYKLSTQDIKSRGYMLASNKDAIIVKIPIGALGGNYKSHVVDRKLMITYKINIFVEHLWEDDKRGITKHLILKKISTPLQLAPIRITDYTKINLKLFNATVGSFLPDVDLVGVTVGHSGPLPLPEAEKWGCKIIEIKHPNGSKDYLVQISFDSPGVEKEYVPEHFRNYTTNPVLQFTVIPQAEVFEVPVPLSALVRDAVLPHAEGFCDNEALYLVVKRGNVDQNWLPFVGNTPLTQETAQTLQYGLQVNQTHLVLRVPKLATHVFLEEINSFGIVFTFQLQFKDHLSQIEMIEFTISCSFSPKDLIDCQPNGTIAVSARTLVGMPDLDLSNLVLRDKRCKPASVTKAGADFLFSVNSCGTTRKFEKTIMTYENEVLYFLPGQATPVYQLKCACQYFIGNTLLFQYSPARAPSPTILPGTGQLELALKLARDQSYKDFYQRTEYPVSRYLREPLYFQVELLHSQDPQLELFLENCWATAKSDRNSFPQWHIVVDSCENTADSHQTIFHDVPNNSVPFPTHLKRFEVKMFTFVVNSQAVKGQIYIHCSAVICDSTQPSSDALCIRHCIPRKQRAGRSIDSSNDIQGYVSSGAIVIGRRNDS